MGNDIHFKKGIILSVILAGAITFVGGNVQASIPSSTANTASVKQSSDATISVDGKEKTYKVNPYVSGSTVLIPADAFKTLGGKVNTKGNTTTITKGKTKVTVTTGSKTLKKGKKSYTLPEKVVKKSGVVMIPANAIKKVFPETKKAEISTKNKKVTIRSVRLSDGILVYYGSHTYGTKNQKEYDYVMKKVEVKISKLSSTKIFNKPEPEKYFKEYLNGKRWDGDLNLLDDRQFWLWNFEDSIGDLTKAGVSKFEIEKLLKLASIYDKLQDNAEDPLTGAPSSAYDTLYKKLSDCDSDAQLYSAVMDSAGYPNAIFATKTHAFFVVKIKGEWYDVQGGMYFKLNSKDRQELINSKEYRFLSQPTSGTFK